MNPVKSAWRIVAVREVFTKLKDKSFIFSTLLTLLIIGVSIGVTAFMSSRTSEANIAVTSEVGQSIVASADASQEEADANQRFTSSTFDNREAALNAVRSEDAAAALLQTNDGWGLTFKSGQDSSIAAPLTRAVSSLVTAQNAQAQGVDLAALSQGSNLTTDVLTGEDNSLAAMFVGLAFGMVFYMAIILFGQLIAMSVVEEKQNRIVEIIATAIPTSQLLAGKILGNTALAIGQVALYAIVALTALNLTGLSDDFGWVFASAGWFIIFYIVGFVALATIWAGIGAMSSRVEDIGTIAAPVLMVSMAAFFGGVYAKGTLLTVLSFVPVTSSIAMPMRLLTEEVAIWQPLLAVVLTLVATYFLTKLGARIYRNNIMRGGAAVTWKQVLKKQDAA